MNVSLVSKKQTKIVFWLKVRVPNFITEEQHATINHIGSQTTRTIKTAIKKQAFRVFVFKNPNETSIKNRVFENTIIVVTSVAHLKETELVVMAIVRLEEPPLNRGVTYDKTTISAIVIFLETRKPKTIFDTVIYPKLNPIILPIFYVFLEHEKPISSKVPMNGWHIVHSVHHVPYVI